MVERWILEMHLVWNNGRHIWYRLNKNSQKLYCRSLYDLCIEIDGLVHDKNYVEIGYANTQIARTGVKTNYAIKFEEETRYADIHYRSIDLEPVSIVFFVTPIYSLYDCGRTPIRYLYCNNTLTIWFKPQTTFDPIAKWEHEGF